MTAKTTKRIILIISFAALLLAVLFRSESLISMLSGVYSIVKPVIIGVLFALSFDGAITFLEKRMFASAKIKQKTKRGLSAAIIYTIFLVLVILTIFFLVPEIAKSVKTIIERLPKYIGKITEFFNTVNEKLGFDVFSADGLFAKSENPRPFLESAVNAINSLVDMSSELIRFFLSFILSVYLIVDKPRILRAVERLKKRTKDNPTAYGLIDYSVYFARAFKGFINGQLIEALILGSLCFLGMVIIGLPYSAFISITIAITSIIPVIGAYIGAVPSVFLLLLENPLQAAIFLVFLVALQQFEGGVIYPKVVGDAVGIDGLTVFVAVLLGAGFGGIMGVILCVPLFAVIAKVAKKELFTETEIKNSTHQ